MLISKKKIQIMPFALLLTSSSLMLLSPAFFSCSGRKIGGGDEVPDSSIIEEKDGSVEDDGSVPVDGSAQESCETQFILPCEDDCVSVEGAWWNGEFCMPIICCCEGPDCDDTYEDPASCLEAHSHCDLNSCAATGGYCEIGDFVPPTCHEGYGEAYDPNVYEQDPNVCSLGICCSPCPDPDDPHVNYVSTNLEICSQDDWGCSPDKIRFSNECGCGCIGQEEKDCAPQEINPCPDPCVNVEGAWWDGEFCMPIICCCEGPDCDDTYDDPASCLAGHSHCDLNSCAATGGYCEYGDFVPPTCHEGYGQAYDPNVYEQDPNVCGLGICCSPCPDPDDPDVDYVYHDPDLCNQNNWACLPETISFSNECGCGCIFLGRPQRVMPPSSPGPAGEN